MRAQIARHALGGQESDVPLERGGIRGRRRRAGAHGRHRLGDHEGDPAEGDRRAEREDAEERTDPQLIAHAASLRTGHAPW